MGESVLCITKDKEWPIGATIDTVLSASFLDYYSKQLWCETAFLERAIAGDPPGKPGQFLQVIPYVCLFDAESSTIMRYRRSKKGGDARLFGKWSIGVGGHITLADAYNGMSFRQIINRGLLREINEEWAFDYFSISSMPGGLIYDRSNEVGSVHIGLVYFAFVSGAFSIEKDRHTDFEFTGLSEMENDLGSFESWSQLLIAELRK